MPANYNGNERKLLASLEKYPHGAGWEDLLMPFPAARGSGTQEPVWKDIGNGIYAMHFTTGDELFASYHVPHIYKIGSKVYYHIHWLCDIAMTAGDTVVWGVEYVQAAIGESLTASTNSITLTYTADGTEVAGQHIIVEVSEESSFIFPEIDALILSRVSLLSVSVTGTERIFGIMADIHYETDGFRTSTKESPYLKLRDS